MFGKKKQTSQIGLKIYLEEQLEILNDQETNLNSYSMRINQLEALLMKNKIRQN